MKSQSLFILPHGCRQICLHISDRTGIAMATQCCVYNFSVDENSGMITMLHNVPLGTWTFKVDVSDSVDGLTTTSTVTVLIEELPEEAPYKSGSVRLKGMCVKLLNIF